MSETISNDVPIQTNAYVAINLEDVLYGIEFILYFKTMQILLSNRDRNKSDLFYAFFSTMMFFLTSVWVVSQAIFGEKTWIQHRDYPGGPGGQWANHLSDWYMDFGSTSAIVLQLMTDALMIHRCRNVWNSYRVITVPSILWVITLALGIAVLWASCSPGGDFFSAGLASTLGLAYYSISVFLNITVSSIICFRMMRHAMKVKEQLGNEYASAYFVVVSIVVESVLPYALSGLAFLVSSGIGSQSSITFFCVYILVMCISSQVLILRVIMGRAWNKDTGPPQVTTIKFSPDSIGRSQIIDESDPSVHLQVSSKVYLADSENIV
ncbi:hypothetical protein PAXRUDRAFT_293772 [Paxillus rubicundulus Ve08.2h10]|uniref:Chitin synthase export chaperone n=1 Tax=Paxillus rubicundulus Ve08.2h10 TaxID=930991 RepID=A0A0D0DFR7_9AGAM|nr:hypothetical protein PAXRUDRAFT_293772 [Paxillus rubicundulus Ve08.2h10]